jgi:hypothetical protein
MTKNKLNLKKVVTIAICLAVVTMFSGCDKDGNLTKDDEETLESWIELAGEKYYNYSLKKVVHKVSLDGNVHCPYSWEFQFWAGKGTSTNSTNVALYLRIINKTNDNPNGTYWLTSDPEEWNEAFNEWDPNLNLGSYNHSGNGDHSVCGILCFLVETVNVNGVITTTTWYITSGTLEVNKESNIWTINAKAESKDESGNTRSIGLNYKGEMMVTSF